MISILMPIYNGIEFIGGAVASILNQTDERWELIIGINGHPQDSDVYKKAKTYENIKIKVFDLYTVKGKSNALNEMLKYCQYNYVALLDVDDIWTQTKLKYQLTILEKQNYDVIGTKCVYFGENNTSPFIPTGDISNFNFKSFNPIINSSAIIKKELCFWNIMYDGVEDYELWLRLKKQNKTFYNCPEILVKHRINKSSFFNSSIKQNELLKKLLQEY